MSSAGTVLGMLVNHPRASDPDRLHDAVSGATVLVTGASFGIGTQLHAPLAPCPLGRQAVMSSHSASTPELPRLEESSVARRIITGMRGNRVHRQ
jgi:hypothetical protein